MGDCGAQLLPRSTCFGVVVASRASAIGAAPSLLSFGRHALEYSTLGVLFVSCFGCVSACAGCPIDLIPRRRSFP
eukprot:8212907-Pyramimonas_sp.AAC.1